MPEPLPEGITLRVWAGEPAGVPVFESRGRWLHPLFDLTAFLEGRPDLDRSTLGLRDRIIGRAAAFLIVRLGIRIVLADVVSRRALTVFGPRGVTVTASTTVEAIDCQTEEQLASVTDADEAFGLLEERRRRAQRVGS